MVETMSGDELRQAMQTTRTCSLCGKVHPIVRGWLVRVEGCALGFLEGEIPTGSGYGRGFATSDRVSDSDAVKALVGVVVRARSQRGTHAVVWWREGELHHATAPVFDESSASRAFLARLVSPDLDAVAVVLWPLRDLGALHVATRDRGAWRHVVLNKAETDERIAADLLAVIGGEFRGRA